MAACMASTLNCFAKLYPIPPTAKIVIMSKLAVAGIFNIVAQLSPSKLLIISFQFGIGKLVKTKRVNPRSTTVWIIRNHHESQSSICFHRSSLPSVLTLFLTSLKFLHFSSSHLRAIWQITRSPLLLQHFYYFALAF